MTRHRSTTRGFSLVEILLAIFVLGIGILSIATLFPAGLIQQQRTRDDIVGPIVARNAMALLRSRLDQEDFGTCEEWDAAWSARLDDPGNSNPRPTVDGDWMWRRPGIYPNGTITDSGDLSGALDIFAFDRDGAIIEGGRAGDNAWAASPYYARTPGIPYNTDGTRYTSPSPGTQQVVEPQIRVLAQERFFPMTSGRDGGEVSDPQYVWDCMFRRYSGRILVAVFVYRVVEDKARQGYVVDMTGLSEPDLPRSLDLSTSSSGFWNGGLLDNGNFDFPKELAGTADDDPTLPANQWQMPGQWIIDQNGGIHQIERGRRRESDGPATLGAMPSPLAAFQINDPALLWTPNVNWWDRSVDPSGLGTVEQGVVTDIWFVPTRSAIPGATNTAAMRKLVPVYAVVQEL
jgi:prepilin-type N-terminal cleavage/methylation domain-containing protein